MLALGSCARRGAAASSGRTARVPPLIGSIMTKRDAQFFGQGIAAAAGHFLGPLVGVQIVVLDLAEIPGGWSRRICSRPA